MQRAAWLVVIIIVTVGLTVEIVRAQTVREAINAGLSE